jgi:hypothetical protein
MLRRAAGLHAARVICQLPDGPTLFWVGPSVAGTASKPGVAGRSLTRWLVVTQHSTRGFRGPISRLSSSLQLDNLPIDYPSKHFTVDFSKPAIRLSVLPCPFLCFHG